MLPRTSCILILLLLQPALLLAEEPADRSSFLQDIVVAPGGEARDVVCFFCSVEVQGEVRNVASIGGSVTVAGSVGGDAVAVGGALRLLPGARVGGEAVAVGGPLDRSPQASLQTPPYSATLFHLPGQRHFFLPGVIFFVAVNMGLAMITALVLRRPRVENLAGSLRTRFGQTLLLGSVLLLFFTLLYGASAVTGQFFSFLYPILSIALVSALLVGYAGLNLFVGRKLPVGSGHWQGLLAGAAATTTLLLIPLAGFILLLVFCALALGSAVLGGFGSEPDWLIKRLSRLLKTRPQQSSR